MSKLQERRQEILDKKRAEENKDQAEKLVSSFYDRCTSEILAVFKTLSDNPREVSSFNRITGEDGRLFFKHLKADIRSAINNYEDIGEQVTFVLDEAYDNVGSKASTFSSNELAYLYIPLRFKTINPNDEYVDVDRFAGFDDVEDPHDVISVAISRVLAVIYQDVLIRAGIKELLEELQLINEGD